MLPHGVNQPTGTAGALRWAVGSAFLQTWQLSQQSKNIPFLPCSPPMTSFFTFLPPNLCYVAHTRLSILSVNIDILYALTKISYMPRNVRSLMTVFRLK